MSGTDRGALQSTRGCRVSRRTRGRRCAAPWECGLLPRAAPSRRSCLVLGAEPPLPLRRVDSGLVVVAPARHVVDARAVLADIALDVAPSAALLPSRRPRPAEALALAPLPGRNDLAAPHAPPRRPCRRFLANVRIRVPPVGERPTFRDHPRIEVPPGGAARRNDPTVAVPITFLAFNRPSADPSRKRPRCLTAARPPLAPGPASLPALRRIDPVQPDSDSAHIERIAVDHTRGTRNHAGSLGNSDRLLLSGFRIIPRSDFSPSKPISKRVRLPLEPVCRALRYRPSHRLNRLEVPAQGVLRFAPRRRRSRSDRSCSDRDQDYGLCGSLHPPPHPVRSPETLTTPSSQSVSPLSRH